jgi:hypothetical protein
MDGFDMQYFINLNFGVLSFLHEEIGGESRLTISWIPGISFYIICIDAKRSLWRDLVAMGCNGVRFNRSGLTGYCFTSVQSSQHFCWLTGLDDRERYYDCLA